ncbi:alpha-L-fucosidase [Streptomyces sp. FIT100]|uniref:alpha-L-fucosidase n=1 Tax=Streptomyces sp. FIT100 TaxID=2837956 RepID=UPI0021CADA99|nr:alpha-L-fucosidase [Streptomyces sp. FIT100]
MPPRAPAASVRRFQSWRFGLFVHWGLYSAAARHEWVKYRERLTDQQYQPYFDHFDADLYDPGAWAELATQAGMRYAVLTTKHHEGFCLWDSDLTDYKVTRTPHGKDAVGPFIEAFRTAGLGIGLYHSLIDWHHPDFTVDSHHPQRDDTAARSADTGRDMGRYADHLNGQVRELLTRYGGIDIMWFDFSYPDHDIYEQPISDGKGRAAWRSERLVETVRSLQPDILLNDRLDLPGSADFTTAEQYQPAGPVLVDGHPVVWEACHTLNGSWGYDRDNLDDKPAELLVRMLVDAVSKDGNLLLNVGPNARGEIDQRAARTLREIGAWMRLHSSAIHDAGPSTYEAPDGCRYTQRGDRLYLHLFTWPMKHVRLPGLAGKVRYARFLADHSEVRRDEPPADGAGSTLTLELPVQRPDVAVPVVELVLHDS